MRYPPPAVVPADERPRRPSLDPAGQPRRARGDAAHRASGNGDHRGISAVFACSAQESDALPASDHPLRAAVWTFLRLVLSPRLTELNRGAFVHDTGIETTVDLDAYRADADLGELDIGDDSPQAA